MLGQNDRLVTNHDAAPQHSGDRLNRSLQRAMEQIEEALQGLRFGQVTITVQDGVVVQIDRLERTRLQKGE
jgi:hypothetical protein